MYSSVVYRGAGSGTGALSRSEHIGLEMSFSVEMLWCR